MTKNLTGIFNGRAEQLTAKLRAEGHEYGLSLGRRAPMHYMHVDCVMEIVQAGLKPVIVIGSADGPDSKLYDPIRNPMTVEQQKEQLRLALGDIDYGAARIITLNDHWDDNAWMHDFVDQVKALGIHGKAVVHLRSKAVDAAKMGDAIKPLSTYEQAFVNSGMPVWHSYNGNPTDDAVSASDIRAYDLEHLTPEQRRTMATPAYIVSLARAARDSNPDAALLAQHNIPLTVLDLSFDRIRREMGIATADIVAKAAENGAVTSKTLAEAATTLVKAAPRIKRAHHLTSTNKPLLIIGDSISPETARILSKDGMFEPLSASIGKFQSDEPYTEFLYKDAATDKAAKIRGRDVVIVQSTARPVADHCLHLFEMIHTAKRNGAKNITVVMPFAAFARQDRSFDGRCTSVSPEMLPVLLKAAGADKVVTATMHSQAGIDFYKDTFGAENFANISVYDVFAKRLKEKYPFTSAQIIVGAPDGAEKPNDQGQKRAEEFSTFLTGVFNEKSLFKIGKTHTATNETKVVSFDGDVAGKHCVIIDDMVDGGGTMLNAANILKEKGAKSVTCCFTHAILTPGAGSTLEKLMVSKLADGRPVIDQLMMTDSVPEAAAKITDFAKQYPDLAKKIEMIPLGEAIAAALKASVPAPSATQVRKLA